MINVNYGTNAAPIRSAIVDENTSIREFCASHDVDCTRLTISIDGETIRGESLDMSFKDFGIKAGARERCYLLGVIKADNAAKVSIVGSVAMISTEIGIEALEDIEKYEPDALILRNDDNIEVFRVMTGMPASVGKYGICFDKDKNADGNASIVVCLPVGETPTDFMFDKYGAIVCNLSKIEEGYEAALAKIAEKKAAFASIVTTI